MKWSPEKKGDSLVIEDDGLKIAYRIQSYQWMNALGTEWGGLRLKFCFSKAQDFYHMRKFEIETNSSTRKISIGFASGRHFWVLEFETALVWDILVVCAVNCLKNFVL